DRRGARRETDSDGAWRRVRAAGRAGRRPTMNAIPFLQSARARLTLWNVLVLAFALMALGCALRVSLARNLMASIDSDLAGRARRHTDFWARNPWATHDTSRWLQRWRQETGKTAGKGALKETFESHPATDSGVASRWRTPIIER